MEKMSLKERIETFIEELKKEYPSVETEGIVEAFVLVGVNPCNDGDLDIYGTAKGNKMSICAALTALFKNEEMKELLDIASGFAIERMKKKEAEKEQEE